MPSALEMFQAQRQAAEEVRASLQEVSKLLRAVKQELNQLAQDRSLRELLQQEQTWLVRATDLVRRVERFREAETARFWPAVWKRWLVAILLTLLTGTAAGAGYVWAARPYAEELATLRIGAAMERAILRRLIEMSPAERRQFEALMNWGPTPER